MKVAVVGGGISGLASAFYVKRLAPQTEVLLVEAEPVLGGTMRTEEVRGFLFEWGSNGFLTNKPATLDLVRDSGGEGLLLPSNDAARVRYIYTDRLHRLPESPPAFLKSRLLSWPGKLRVAWEVFTPPRRDQGEETLQAFGERRVGKEFTDVFLNAMVAGIYGSTPDRISVNAAFPLVVRLEREYGGLFKGMIKKRRKEAGPGGVLMSFVGGVQTFIRHLQMTLDADVRTGAPVEALERVPGGLRLTVGGVPVDADRVILATPAYTAAGLLGAVAPEAARRLVAVEYSPISVVGLGWDALDHDLAGFGLLTTASAGKDILGVLWDSSVFTDRAPPGRKSVRVMIGGQRQPELARRDDAELVAIARRGLAETMGVQAEPSVTFVKRWDRGIPNYPVGHLANVDAAFQALATAAPGVYLTSNAYYGISLNDCVANAKATAAQVVAGEPLTRPN